MIGWILLIASGLTLVLMFLRRIRLTLQDIRFQKNLAEQEAAEELEELEEEILVDATDHEEKEKKSGSLRKMFLKADMLFSRGDLDDAEKLLLEILDSDENHIDANHKLGLLYMKKNEFQKAELYFSKLVNLKKDAVYFSNLGASLYRQQRLVEAAEAYENAIALDNRRSARLQSLAQVYYELGEDEKALKYFEMAARKKPKDLDLKYILADYYERLDRFDDAIEQLKKILEADPYNKDAKKRLKEIKSQPS